MTNTSAITVALWLMPGFAATGSRKMLCKYLRRNGLRSRRRNTINLVGGWSRDLQPSGRASVLESQHHQPRWRLVTPKKVSVHLHNRSSQHHQPRWRLDTRACIRRRQQPCGVATPSTSLEVGHTTVLANAMVFASESQHHQPRWRLDTSAATSRPACFGRCRNINNLVGG